MVYASIEAQEIVDNLLIKLDRGHSILVDWFHCKWIPKHIDPVSCNQDIDTLKKKDSDVEEGTALT